MAEKVSKFSGSPVYVFQEETFKILTESGLKSAFDDLLQSTWNDLMEKGHFRYKLNHLHTKILHGKYSFVAQLNVKRAQERRKPQFISTISMPFDPELFNFLKIKSEEVLFRLRPLHWENTESNYEDHKAGELSNNVLIINVSPLEFCNSLLVPHIHQSFPQIITYDGLRLAIETMLLSWNPSLRIGFNSLGAYASVNHLHFHVYYLQQKLYLETAIVQHLSGDCYVISDFPSEGFAFQLLDTDVVKITRSVMKLATFLQNKEIAHNIFITRGRSFSYFPDATTCPSRESYEAVRIYIWARKATYGSKNDFAFNPALCELAGHLPIKCEKDFDTITEEYSAKILHNECHEIFMQVCESVKNIFDVDVKN